MRQDGAVAGAVTSLEPTGEDGVGKAGRGERNLPPALEEQILHICPTPLKLDLDATHRSLSLALGAWSLGTLSIGWASRAQRGAWWAVVRQRPGSHPFHPLINPLRLSVSRVLFSPPS